MITDDEERFAQWNGVVHVARLVVHQYGQASLHMLCDPKPKLDPATETRRRVVTCMTCIAGSMAHDNIPTLVSAWIDACVILGNAMERKHGDARNKGS